VDICVDVRTKDSSTMVVLSVLNIKYGRSVILLYLKISLSPATSMKTPGRAFK